ncbi:bifunctional precorrin-2 dehydrogenase/sirohydrochlorin ferrochelatase [Arcticibacter sp. MXS-1]|uniref:precorrin-2 dehydrogenase/sirohydrochlorin ferrochelatase family protein n=1 Tax=Arcticibacter sp. MXS-1 TaxID=3341726 RepID=UPI0035A87134
MQNDHTDTTPAQAAVNHLFPIFLKLENLNLLLVGGGNVALEKLEAIFGNCPAARVRLVATDIFPQVQTFLNKHQIAHEQRAFREEDLQNVDVAIIAVNDPEASAAIHRACKSKGVLTNVADKPSYCDFYLSSIVQKGNLKIAISTNGKSPTIAKRVKEVLNETFPDEIEDVLSNMQQIRNSLKGDFSEKVRKLNSITEVLAQSPAQQDRPKTRRKPSILLSFILVLAGILAGYLLSRLI